MGVWRPNAWTNFWWNLVSKRKLGPQWQPRDQILIFLNSKWRTAAILENIRNIRLPMDRLRPNLGGHIPSCPRHVPTIRLAWQRPLPSNSALNILQLWASGGRTREPILIKFGIQQHVRTRTTVTWLYIKIFKIQNGGRPLWRSATWRYWILLTCARQFSLWTSCLFDVWFCMLRAGPF